MKDKIVNLIEQYIKEYSTKKNTKTTWKRPIIGFASANDKCFIGLKQIVSKNHLLPEDFLCDAKTVISYFIPFTEEMANSNIDGKFSSREWAVGYLETNTLIDDINNHVKDKVENINSKYIVMPGNFEFDKEKLISNWSQRHVAYIAGLGKFGINNMLITDKGSCGRFGSVITNLDIEPTKRLEEENCLYKSIGICKKCLEKCESGALSEKKFDRYKCFDLVMENDKFHFDLDLTDVCGKCCVGLPCSFTNPNNFKK